MLEKDVIDVEKFKEVEGKLLVGNTAYITPKEGKKEEFKVILDAIDEEVRQYKIKQLCAQ